jgi:hypothetical protein
MQQCFHHIIFIVLIQTCAPTVDNEESHEPTKRRNRLGPAGLALHYANIICQINTLVSSQTPLIFLKLYSVVCGENSIGWYLHIIKQISYPADAILLISHVPCFPRLNWENATFLED